MRTREAGARWIGMLLFGIGLTFAVRIMRIVDSDDRRIGIPMVFPAGSRLRPTAIPGVCQRCHRYDLTPGNNVEFRHMDCPRVGSGELTEARLRVNSSAELQTA